MQIEVSAMSVTVQRVSSERFHGKIHCRFFPVRDAPLTELTVKIEYGDRMRAEAPSLSLLLVYTFAMLIRAELSSCLLRRVHRAELSSCLLRRVHC